MTTTPTTVNDDKLRRRADVLYEASTMNANSPADREVLAIAFDGNEDSWNSLPDVLREIQTRQLDYYLPEKNHEEIAVTLQKPWWE